MTATATASMNRMYRRQRHVYDATRKYYLLGRDRLIAGLGAGPGDRVLEIGCGTGRNLLVAAERFRHSRFYGIDVSTEMLTSAIGHIERAGRSGQIRVAHGDATAFDPETTFRVERFDRIFISYSLSMIPAWRLVMDNAVSRLAPGGELHIVDFGNQAGLPGWFRAALRRWLALFHVTPRDTLQAELIRIAQRTGANVTVSRPYRDYAQLARLSLR